MGEDSRNGLDPGSLLHRITSPFFFFFYRQLNDSGNPAGFNLHAVAFQACC